MQNPRSSWRWLNGQSPGSVVIINKVCSTNNIILNNDFWNCLQRCCNFFFFFFLYECLGLLQGIQKHFQWNLSLAVSAVLYHRWGHLDLAKKHYEISLQLDPTASGTKENYGLLRRKLEQMQKKDVWSFFPAFCVCLCAWGLSLTWCGFVWPFKSLTCCLFYSGVFFSMKKRHAKRLQHQQYTLECLMWFLHWNCIFSDDSSVNSKIPRMKSFLIKKEKREKKLSAATYSRMKAAFGVWAMLYRDEHSYMSVMSKKWQTDSYNLYK